MKRLEDEEIIVETGQLIQIECSKTFYSGPLGTCIAIVFYSSLAKLGLFSHIMLPDAPNEMNDHDNRYAAIAINNVLKIIAEKSMVPKQFHVCIAGGANVLKRENCTIGQKNIASVLKILEKESFIVNKASLGGFERRQFMFDVNTKELRLSIGDGIYEPFYFFN